MTGSICYIVGASEPGRLDFTVRDGDFVIAADGGFAHLHEQGIVADLLVGDFDSLATIPERENIVVLDREKDDTDTFAAVREGMDRGYTSFCVYGGLGGRIDHTLANLQMLVWLSQKGLRGILAGPEEAITAITNSHLSFPPRDGGVVSVFSASERSSGVCLTGLKYELANTVLTSAFPLGVSNEFIGAESRITVADGTLIVVFPRVILHKLLPREQ